MRLGPGKVAAGALRYKGRPYRDRRTEQNGDRGRTLLNAVLAVAAMHVLMGEGAVADGAVAVGSTGDVVKHGIAFGMVVNEPKEKAADLALARCRAFVKGSSPEATARCKVMATFSRECFAVAYDPQPGNAGGRLGRRQGPDRRQPERDENVRGNRRARDGPGSARWKAGAAIPAIEGAPAAQCHAGQRKHIDHYSAAVAC